MSTLNDSLSTILSSSFLIFAFVVMIGLSTVLLFASLLYACREAIIHGLMRPIRYICDISTPQ